MEKEETIANDFEEKEWRGRMECFFFNSPHRIGEEEIETKEKRRNRNEGEEKKSKRRKRIQRQHKWMNGCLLLSFTPVIQNKSSQFFSRSFLHKYTLTGTQISSSSHNQNVSSLNSHFIEVKCFDTKKKFEKRRGWEGKNHAHILC